MILAFSIAHIIRMIAARWLRLPPVSVGVLGFEHQSREEPVMTLWNYVTHLRD